MDNDFVTKTELGAVMSEFELKMQAGFTKLEQQIAELRNALVVSQLESDKAADVKYLSRKDSMENAMQRLNDPTYRRACHVIANEYVASEEGRERMGCVIDSYISSKRDNATKWITFLKTAAALVIAVVVAYGGNTIIEAQKSNQKALTTLIETLK